MSRLTRRAFLSRSAGFGAGLLLGACSGCNEPVIFAPRARGGTPGNPMAEDAAMLGWLLVSPEGIVTVSIPSSEMGQGVYTNLALLVAEELDVDFASVRAVHAPVGKQFGNPRMRGGQLTGGSTSTVGFWEPMREVGAAARQMLLSAAAARWEVPLSSLDTRPGVVFHSEKGELPYGALAEDAATLAPPGNPRLKDPLDFRLIGTSVKRLDSPAKVAGTAVFGIDVVRPGMAHGVVLQSPAFKGRVELVKGAEAVRARTGVLGVFVYDTWLAVVAEGRWQAGQALKALEVRFTTAGAPAPGTEDHRAALAAALDKKGKADLSDEPTRLDVEYEVPFLEHATMSPINCTAHVYKGGVEVWAPTQAQSSSQEVAAEVAGVEPERVRIHTTYLGGGFGRRAETDFVRQAVTLSKAVGRPVKVVWSREETTGHGFYRPAVRSRFQVALNGAGEPYRWANQLALPYLLMQKVAVVPDVVWEMTGDVIGIHGAKRPPYATGDLDVDTLHVDLHTPLGFFRSVGHSYNGFFVESVVDELAALNKEDPARFRRRFYGEHPRHLAVLDALVELSKWHQPRAPGRHVGMAVHASFGSVVGQVVEISVKGREVTFHRVWCAIECGLVVNPDSVRAQMEGGIVFGLTGATRGKITMKDGAVMQSNFHDYPLLGMAETPPIEVRIVGGGTEPTGVGETAVGPIAPALGNAIFAATGERVRRLPFSDAGFRGWKAFRG